jgi:DNA-3-methyladenine glycosylase
LQRANKKLPKKFYLGPTLSVAKALLGKVLFTRINGKLTGGIIVEVEAYRSDIDQAAHSYQNRSKRTEVMFWEGGYCYVYLIYGMHYCVNVVTERKDFGAAVLIRAIEPLVGIKTMRKRRKLANDHNLANGPAKLCQALAIDKRLWGEKLYRSRKIWIAQNPIKVRRKILTSKRIGITKSVNLPWRFYFEGLN